MIKNNYILYSFRRCPFAIRARMAIYASNINVELREVLLRDKPTLMTDLSPKGTVPVLKVSNIVIDESLDIMSWALSKNDPFELLEPLKENNQLIYSIIKKIDNNFKFHLDRYKYSENFKKNNHKVSKLNHRSKALSILKELEEKCFINNSLWLYGDKVSFLDLAVFPLIRQYRGVDSLWFDNLIEIKKITNWTKLFMENYIFTKSMTKYAVWKNKDKPVYFGSDKL